MRTFLRVLVTTLLLTPGLLIASEGASAMPQDFTRTWPALLALAIFVFAYVLVIFEEQLHLRKSKPVTIAAGIIWAIVALLYSHTGDIHTAEIMVRHNLLEFAELFLFLLAAMTYINTMEYMGVFDSLRVWLVSRGFSLRTIFWLTGLISFFLSPIADNLTTALLMSTVAMAVGGSNTKFVVIACINIVVAANAGGAFSPFGDITTLMVWQKGIIQFGEFFALFFPSLVNWLIPATIMSLAIPNEQPEAAAGKAQLMDGAGVVIALFILTIIMAVSAHNFLHLPPVLGMMTGLGLLKFYGYILKRRTQNHTVVLPENIADRALESASSDQQLTDTPSDQTPSDQGYQPPQRTFNIFKSLARAEWDTLMFFYGVILCVGGLGALGYLTLVSSLMYDGLGPTNANILVGLLSAIVDNIPVMFAVLTMMPEMDHSQWLLVTLTAGVGGSLLSVGSAAGVAVMGQARGVYTFFSHLKWSWAIALGYAASIWLHLYMNGATAT